MTLSWQLVCVGPADTAINYGYLEDVICAESARSAHGSLSSAVVIPLPIHP